MTREEQENPPSTALRPDLQQNLTRTTDCPLLPKTQGNKKHFMETFETNHVQKNCGMPHEKRHLRQITHSKYTRYSIPSSFYKIQIRSQDMLKDNDKEGK